jgi:GntR family transcriptional regulator
VSPVRSKPQQVEAAYADLIDRGMLPPGEPFPSIRAIAAEQQVSPDVASLAVRALAGSGRIEKVPGRGYIVARRARENVPSPQMRATAARVPTLWEQSGIEHVTEVGIVPPPEYVAGTLGVPLGELVIRRETVVIQDDGPVRLTVQWIPSTGSPSVVCAHLLDPEPVEGGVLACLERSTGRKVTFADEAVRAERADAREAGHLRIPHGSPVLGIVTKFCTDAGVLMYEESVYLEDRLIAYTYPLGG